MGRAVATIVESNAAMSITSISPTKTTAKSRPWSLCGPSATVVLATPLAFPSRRSSVTPPEPNGWTGRCQLTLDGLR